MTRYLQRLGFVLLATVFFAGPAFAQQWDFEDGLGGWSATGGEAVIIDSLVYSGSSAVSLTAAGDASETNFQNTSITNIAAGDSIYFNVYVPAADTAAINGFQVFVQHGDGWSWESKWINKSDLEMNAWNRVYYQVPEHAGVLQAIGFQITGHTAEGTPSVVIDLVGKVGAGSTEPTTPGEWSFEDGELGEWAATGASAEVVDTMAFDGTHSLKLTSTSEATEAFLQNTTYKDLAEGDTLRFAVYVPASDTAGINGFQPHMQHGDNWTWSAQWVNLSSLEIDAWNEIQYVIPALDGDVQVFGFQMLSRTAADTPSIFIDLISKHPYPEQGPDLGAPSALAVSSFGTTSATLNWAPATGDVQGYVVHRGTQAGFTPSTATVVDSTAASDTTFTDTGLRAETVYFYKVVAFDADGNTSDASNEVTVTTEAFEHYATWDFEDESLGDWFANDYASGGIGGSIALIDTASQSGHYAVALEKDPDLEKVHLSNDNTSQLIAGQTIRYQVWIPVDPAGISSVQPFIQHSNYGSWVGNQYAVGDLEAGAWNEVSVLVPDVAVDQINRMGLEVLYSSNDAGTVVVDLITTDPNEKGVSKLPAPSNLTRGMFSQTSASLSWDASSGDVSGYRVYHSTEQGAAITDMVRTGSTGSSKTEFLASPLYSETTYYFKVVAVDGSGRETEPSNELQVRTSRFSSHQYWDFEEEGELAFSTSPSGSATGTIERTDTLAYSGSYSLKVTTGATETFFLTEAPEFPGTSIGHVAPGRWLRFNIWVAAEDTAGILAFSPYYQDGNWGWADKWVDISSIEPDQWNTIEIFIPGDTDGLNRIGLDIRGDGGNPNAEVFIDMITTDPYPELKSTAGAPAGLSAAAEADNTVELSWTASTGDVVEYKVYRGSSDAESFADLEHVGTTSETSYTDTGLEAGVYNYAVTAVDEQGRESAATALVNITVTALEDGRAVPKTFKLSDNYPNPFNPTTLIQYQVPQTAKVTISVYNITGRLVQTLVKETRNPGTYSVDFNAGNLSSGVYLYRMQAGSFNTVKRMMLIK